MLVLLFKPNILRANYYFSEIYIINIRIHFLLASQTSLYIIRFLFFDEYINRLLLVSITVYFVLLQQKQVSEMSQSKYVNSFCGEKYCSNLCIRYIHGAEYCVSHTCKVDGCANRLVGESRLCIRHMINTDRKWLPLRKKVNYEITSRPGKKLIPQWSMKNDLKCDEVIVNRVPTLQNIAAAAIVANDIDNTDHFGFNRLWNDIGMGDTTIEVVICRLCDNTCSSHVCVNDCPLTTRYMKANHAYDWRETHGISAAFPYAPYDVVFRKDAKDISIDPTHNQRRRNCSAKRKLSFSSSD